ncbi:hypothetical protein CHS0354_022861, partial [Potamilus streckersoni]
MALSPTTTTTTTSHSSNRGISVRFVVVSMCHQVGTFSRCNHVPSGSEGRKMKLSPREVEGLLIHQCGYLAQKRLARGVRLNHPEAIALIVSQ